jgi:hypothetical protein
VIDRARASWVSVAPASDSIDCGEPLPILSETAVSKWTAQALVEEEKQKSDLEAFAG